MSDVVIQVENLGKSYRIGRAQQRHDTLRDALVDGLRAPLGWLRRDGHPAANGTEDHFWALRDVSFEVKRGEVLGVIGRNGAGKSTLLKILSRITEPTEGRAIVHGRVGSLLEVGTGFHPELTGRENIYLNGAILGMKKTEIEHRFDEMVAFAEIERFLDTPVKRYSSGMYVRLAFAVAAHLEPEILLVDEVLAVGDAEFQKKCLGKMGEVACAGRTVLLVSHNMGAVKSLCQSTLQLSSGMVVRLGRSEQVVLAYLGESRGMRSEVTWHESSSPGNDDLRLLGVRVRSDGLNTSGVFSSSRDIFVDVRFLAASRHSSLCVGFDLISAAGEVVARSYQTDSDPSSWPPVQLGENTWSCLIPGGLLNAGRYRVSPRISVHNMYWIVNGDAVVEFEVYLDHGVSPFWYSLDARSRPGVIAPILSWGVREGMES